MLLGKKYFFCGEMNMRIEIKFCDKFLENVTLLDANISSFNEAQLRIYLI